MGADRRLFQRQIAAFEQLIIPDWIDPEPGETLPSYAKRMARAIDPGGPCFVGGASFGGMLAVEMSRHLDAKACFLIGSIRSPDELPFRAGILKPLAYLPPSCSLRLAAWLARAGLALAGRWLRPTVCSLLRQLVDADGRFIRWASLAILGWKPSPGDTSDTPVPVLQIHGDRDWVLPHRLTRPDVLVKGGGHLIPITFPEEVNDFLRSRLGSSKSAR